MKKQKRNFLLVALIVILLAIAVGYAAFSANITISGRQKNQRLFRRQFLEQQLHQEHGMLNSYQQVLIHHHMVLLMLQVTKMIHYQLV